MHRDVEMFMSWPPPHFEAAPLDWQRVKRGSVGTGPSAAAYSIYRGSFPTPAQGRVYDALPPESRTAHAMWLVPDRPGEGAPCVVHLAATGDHGYMRRMHLGLPLVQQVGAVRAGGGRVGVGPKNKGGCRGERGMWLGWRWAQQRWGFSLYSSWCRCCRCRCPQRS